jgi:hypothetical protein
MWKASLVYNIKEYQKNILSRQYENNKMLYLPILSTRLAAYLCDSDLRSDSLWPVDQSCKVKWHGAY